MNKHLPICPTPALTRQISDIHSCSIFYFHLYSIDPKTLEESVPDEELGTSNLPLAKKQSIHNEANCTLNAIRLYRRELKSWMTKSCPQ